MLNFEVNPSSAITGELFAVLIFATIIFIVVPAVFAIIEYRITKKDKRHGVYLMAGVFASALLLGAYSLFVGLLLLTVHWIAAYKQKNEA